MPDDECCKTGVVGSMAVIRGVDVRDEQPVKVTLVATARIELDGDGAQKITHENVVADVVLAIIPATFLSRIKSNMRRRISLSILLGLGSMFVCFSLSHLFWCLAVKSICKYHTIQYHLSVNFLYLIIHLVMMYTSHSSYRQLDQVRPA